jgi:predicted dehydrogenase
LYTCATQAARYFIGKEVPAVEVVAWGDRLFHHEKTDTEMGWMFPPMDEAWIYGYAEEMRHFIECVANNRTPRETFEDGYIVNCILDAAYRSMQTRQWETIAY